MWEVGGRDGLNGNQAWKDYAGRTFPGRAIDNGVFLVAVNACGSVSCGDYEYNGNPVALIYGPLGQLVAESPDEADDEVMVVADLSLRGQASIDTSELSPRGQASIDTSV